MRNKKNSKNVFPWVFRLEDIQCSPGDAGGFNYRAALYHDQVCMMVSFSCDKRASGLKNGALVSVRWLPDLQSLHGAVQIAGLTLMNYPAKNFQQNYFNPFQTVPHTWNIDRHLVDCACGLWDVSSKELRQLLFATVLEKEGITKLQ